MLRIRDYKESDSSAVWRLHRLGLEQTGVDAGVGPWDDDLKSIALTYLQAKGAFLLAELNDQVVGMGALLRLSDTVGEIKRMRVDPAHQRHGFGQVILEALEARAAELGYRKLKLDTTREQQAAQVLYQKNSYREVGRKPWRTTEIIYFEKDLT